MNRADLTEKLLDIKREKGWTWKYICEQIGGMSPVMITGGVLGQQKMTKPMAAAAAKLFGLSKSEQTLLNEVPMRGTGTTMPPTDPLIYRFYELVMVNGPAWKALIEEEFGDGIMSAIDFDMTDRSSARPQRRPGQDQHDRQVPAVQILRRHRECPGLRIEGRLAQSLCALRLRAGFFVSPSTSTCGPISAMRVVPVSAIATLSSFSRMSIALATPSLPRAPSP